MLVKVSELSGVQLDLAVAMCEGVDTDEYSQFNNEPYMPSIDWMQGGPIIEREKIDIINRAELGWLAVSHNYKMQGPTPLIAAMRCYVARWVTK